LICERGLASSQVLQYALLRLRQWWVDCCCDCVCCFCCSNVILFFYTIVSEFKAKKPTAARASFLSHLRIVCACSAVFESVTPTQRKPYALSKHLTLALAAADPERVAACPRVAHHVVVQIAVLDVGYCHGTIRTRDRHQEKYQRMLDGLVSLSFLICHSHRCVHKTSLSGSRHYTRVCCGL
jgi:hypothetical protein